MVKFANFDGNQGTVVASGYLGVPEDRDRSISFWIRTTQQELATICWWGDDLTERDIPDGSESRVRLIGGYIELFGKASSRRSASKVNDGNFHYVVCTWTKKIAAPGHEDFQVANIYIDTALDNGKARGDGFRVTSSAGALESPIRINTPEETEVIIGARPNGQGGFTEFYQGDLDEFAIYHDVLSSGTISGAYNAGVRGADLLSLGQTPALEFWYRMGDDPGDVVPSGTLPFGTFFDQNPTSRHGVVSSGVTIS